MSKTKTNTTHGGARKNSGRKKVADPKKTVNIYINQSIVDRLGLDAVKEIATKSVEKAGKKAVKAIDNL